MEYRYALSRGAIDPIEHQSMQLNVQIGRRADRAGGRFTAFEARLPDQMRRNHPVNDLQYRGEQCAGCTAKRLRSGIGNDSIHWCTGTVGMT